MRDAYIQNLGPASSRCLGRLFVNILRPMSIVLAPSLIMILSAKLTKHMGHLVT